MRSSLDIIRFEDDIVAAFSVKFFLRQLFDKMPLIDKAKASGY